MKSTVLLLAILAPLVACADAHARAGKGAPATDSADARDEKAQKVMEQFQGVMAAAQMKLVMAQSHHDKVVKKARKKVEGLLGEEAKTLGEAVARYSAELAEAAAEEDRVINASKLELARAEAAAANATGPDAWAGPEVQARAKLNAEVGAAERSTRHDAMHQDFAIKEATQNAEEPLEDSLSPLSRKLGDLSPILDQAKQQLEAQVTSAVAKVPATPVANATASVASPMTNSTIKRLETLSSALAAAQKQTRNGTAMAERKLDSFIQQTGKDLAMKADDIKKLLDSAEQAEIRRVRGGAASSPATSRPGRSERQASKPMLRKRS